MIEIIKNAIKSRYDENQEWGFIDECHEDSEILKIIESAEAKSWKPSKESMEALMWCIEGKAPAPTSYMSRMLEDLYDGLVNTFNVDESYVDNLPKTDYTESDIEQLKSLKAKLDASM